MKYLLDHYLEIDNVLDRFGVTNILLNMVRDAQFSAMLFMKFAVEQLIHEKVTFIRETGVGDMLTFLSFIPDKFYQKVSEKLFDFFYE